MKRVFEKTNGVPIGKSKMVQVKRMKNVVEIVHINKKTSGLDQIKKISKTEYVLKETGEIFEYNLSQNKSENLASLKKTFRRIRDLINNNFDGSQNELHVTLTYAENMIDTKRLYSDFKAFWKRFVRKYGAEFDYLSIVEPQARGAWHFHVLIKGKSPEKLFLPNHEIAALWKQGFTSTKSTHGVDNMGAYITAYLADLELNEENAQMMSFDGLKNAEIKTVEVEGKEKRFVKGARVHMYPSGMNIVRSSRGIVPPEVEQLSYKKAKKIVGDVSPNYSTTTTIYDGDHRQLNRITYEQYNLQRIKSNHKS